MAAPTKEKNLKRDIQENIENDDDDDLIGPSIAEAVQAPKKKRKVLEFEKIYLDNLPNAEGYEKSYMHRDVITHIAFSKTNFLITASCDGHVKFWKKCDEEGIEFVKHFRSHLGPVIDLCVSSNGELCCSMSSDNSLKVFDVVNFDMINMMMLTFTPLACGWIYRSGDPVCAVAISEKETSHIHIYDGRGNPDVIYTIDKLHYHPVSLIKYNPVYEVVVSCDQGGMVEYWTGPKYDYQFPKKISWQYKTDTDLYEFMTCKSVPYDLEFSPNGLLFATTSNDHKVRIFKFLSAKISKVLDESLQQYSDMQQMKQVVPNMDFGRRLALERDAEKSHTLYLSNIIFDETGHFLIYPTMLGIKVINLHTNRCVRTLGLPENARFLKLALFQGSAKSISSDMEMTAADNPILQNKFMDPTIFCTALKKNRFYMFTRREPIDSGSVSVDRDVFNEKPSKEDIISATEETGPARLCETCIIHTTMGDIHCTLFYKECPKTVENFCVHSRNAYYNGLIFHRVIKSFMLQTGDPLGNGTGGESIWGGEFEDEFHPSLKHDRPYTLSMANAGPNTNGSQFFITVVPTPWLDNKHTIFGRVTRGMEVIQNISNVKTNPKTDKPYDEIQIVNVSLK